MSKRQLASNENASLLRQAQCQHGTQSQSEAAREARQREVIANLNRDNIHKYLRGLEVTSLTEQMARGITRASADKVAHGLKNGQLQIARNPPPLPLQHLSTDEARGLESRAKRQEIAKKIDYLYEQIRSDSPREGERAGNLQVAYKEVLSKEQHERRVRQIAQEKLERRKRMAQAQQEEERKRKEEEQRKEAMRKLQQEKAREAKRQKIQEKIRRRKEEHEKSMEKEAQSQKELMEAKNRTRLYEEMQEKYKSQVLLPSLEQHKSKLKQIRDFHRRYDLTSIRQHEQTYLQKSLEKSQARRENSPDWHYHPPSHTERLSRLLKEEEAAVQEQLTARRRRLEEQLKRQELYELELKEKHKPKVDEEKRQEIAERLIRERRKYERMHPEIDKRKLGEAYLEIAKRLRRPESVKEEKEEAEGKLLKDPASQPQLPRANHTQQFYEQARRRQMEQLVRSEQRSVGEKCRLLRVEAEKAEERMRQRLELGRVQGDGEAENDAAQLLLSSITAKMAIIDLLKPPPPDHP